MHPRCCRGAAAFQELTLTVGTAVQVRSAMRYCQLLKVWGQNIPDGNSKHKGPEIGTALRGRKKTTMTGAWGWGGVRQTVRSEKGTEDRPGGP